MKPRHVAAGAFTGNRVIGGLSVLNGGTVARQLRHAHVQHHCRFRSRLTPVGQPDKISGGTVQVFAEPGTYTLGNSYPIPATQRGVFGIFSSLPSASRRERSVIQSCYTPAVHRSRKRLLEQDF